ncbi:MAG: Hsp70 family protein [Deltaproteobacteria bacterium]|nr:Hsp70 family protein [Deltaproteobacteria bacterium]
MKEPVIGIDLGTSYSCVATVIDGVPTVIPNEWGERIHASVVSFLDNDRIIVGNEAKKRIISNPENTVYSAKRLIGRYFFSEEVKKARAMCSYQIVEGPNSSVRILINGRQYSIPEISAFILKEMKTIAENFLGTKVKKAVITVPAFFNDNQRHATKDAGKIAGLDVIRVINEPTAAALAYGFGKGISQKVAVYDLGGGTFDISILDIGNDIFEVISTAGDTYLGGDDMDLKILEHFISLIKAQYGFDPTQDKQVLQRLRDHAEKAKIGFSMQDRVDVYIKNLFMGADSKPRDFHTVITSEQFRDMVTPILQKTFKVCDEALQTGRLTIGDIQGVILVGGPTRLPIVRDYVRYYFQKEPLYGINPDEVVAIGAAIQANSLLDEKKKSTFLLDVTPLTLRIATVGGFTEAIIPRNSPLPIERRRKFTTSRDNQDRVRIRVLQGESNKADECELLGEFEFSGFKIAPRGAVTIEVSFDIDSDGIVNVSARDVETGAEQSTTIYLNAGLSAEEVAISQDLAEEVIIERDRSNLPEIKD